MNINAENRVANYQIGIALLSTFLFWFLFLAPAIAAVPPTDNASVPPQAEKGITSANQAIENQGQSQGHRKDGDHVPTDSLAAMDQPISVADTEGEDENQGKGSQKNKGQNAIETLTRVEAKVAGKVPSKSKAPDAIRQARERIQARVS